MLGDDRMIAEPVVECEIETDPGPGLGLGQTKSRQWNRCLDDVTVWLPRGRQADVDGRPRHLRGQEAVDLGQDRISLQDHDPPVTAEDELEVLTLARGPAPTLIETQASQLPRPTDMP
jgi:hypothetical protein